jgi:uncharacterized C2H2 Zn-finger protein
MSWYKCDECGKVFREEDIIQIVSHSGEYWGTPYTERENASPCCRNSFTKGAACKECGEYTDKYKEYCRECKKAVKDKFTNFFLTLSNKEFDIFSEVVCEFVDGDVYMEVTA